MYEAPVLLGRLCSCNYVRRGLSVYIGWKWELMTTSSLQFCSLPFCWGSLCWGSPSWDSPCRGLFCWAPISSRIFCLRTFCSGGFCSGEFCSGEFCLKTFCSRTLVSLKTFCLGEFCSSWFLLRTVLLGSLPSLCVYRIRARSHNDLLRGTRRWFCFVLGPIWSGIPELNAEEQCDYFKFASGRGLIYVCI